MGPKSMRWFSGLFDVPPQIHILPLTLSASHLNVVSDAEKTISAELAIKGGLKISMDIVLGSDMLNVKKIFIQDNASRATISLSRHDNLLTFSFKGNLEKTTLDQLMPQNPWLMAVLPSYRRWIQDPHRVLVKSAQFAQEN